DGLASFECSARSTIEVPADGDALWHTNHPLVPHEGALGNDGASSVARASFLAQALGTARSDEDLRDALADRTAPVSKTGEGGGDGYTLWARVAVHSVPPVVMATAGPPSEVPWVTVEL